MKELICICCPQGCHLMVDEENDYAVTGNSCERGAEYGRTESMAPVRVLTSTVACDGGQILRCPVKTNGAIPKETLSPLLAKIKPTNSEEGIAIEIPVDIFLVSLGLIKTSCGKAA